MRTAHSNGTVNNFGGNYDGAPVEVDGAWQPAGDDYTRGWLWTFQKYDWMGRVVRKIATDGDPQQSSNDSDVFSSHECRNETCQTRISPGGSRSQPLDRKRAMQK